MDTVRAPSDSSRGLDVGLNVGLDGVGLDVGSATGASSDRPARNPRKGLQYFVCSFGHCFRTGHQ